MYETTPTKLRADGWRVIYRDGRVIVQRGTDVFSTTIDSGRWMTRPFDQGWTGASSHERREIVTPESSGGDGVDDDDESAHCAGCDTCEGCPARAGSVCIGCKNCENVCNECQVDIPRDADPHGPHHGEECSFYEPPASPRVVFWDATKEPAEGMFVAWGHHDEPDCPKGWEVDYDRTESAAGEGYIAPIKRAPAVVTCPKCGTSADEDEDNFTLCETFRAYHPFDPKRGVATNALGTTCPSEHFDDGAEDYVLLCNHCTHEGSLSEFGAELKDWE